jgi:hypothetical protein
MKIIITESQYNRILKEEEEITSKFGDKMKDTIWNMGSINAQKYLGGYKNYVKIMFDGNINKFFEETGIEPYIISQDGLNMYIHDSLVDVLNLKPMGKGNYRLLGDFVWTSGGINYKMTVTLNPVEGRFVNNTSRLKDNKYWKVSGSSGDHGWGSGYYTKKQTIGKRGRQQVFKQIIDRFGL